MRSYRVLRPADDPDYIVLDLEFDTSAEAQTFGAALECLRGSGGATPALAGKPQTRILETVERKDY